MVVVTFQTASIAAGAEVSVMDTTAQTTALKTSILNRVVTKIGIAGATINTGVLTMNIGTNAILSMLNGVTNTAGAPIKNEDCAERSDIILANDNLDLRVRNSSGGALQYYVTIEVEDYTDEE